jgi:hypothetical protein
VRITWRDLPPQIQGWVEDLIDGGRIVSSRSQSGGFSPGTADRVETESGRRAFVKAVSADQNEKSPELHRREGDVVAQLPISPRTPRLLGRWDDGHWVALVFEDLGGRTPILPWTVTEIEAAMMALSRLAEDLTPSPISRLPTLIDELRQPFGGWVRIRDDPAARLDRWTREHLDQLVELADRGLAALEGDTVVHADVRADNLLVRPDGSIVVVDWPWASRGASWFDRLLLVLNVDLYGGHDADALLNRHLGQIEPGTVNAVIAGLSGYFTDIARRPADRGLPTVRAFQQAHADSTLDWLRRRLSADSMRPQLSEG